MRAQLDQPRGRYGLLTELAVRMDRNGFGLGKTALQKLVYFLQELHGIDCGYEFTLYTYGPFSRQILSDLDSTAAFRGVEVEYDGLGGYCISPGSRNESVRAYAESFVEEHSRTIDEIIRVFGGLSPKQLELRATIVYVVRELKESGLSATSNDAAAVVHDLKPHFSTGEIEEAIQQLHSRQYASVS